MKKWEKCKVSYTRNTNKKASNYSLGGEILFHADSIKDLEVT